MVVGQSPWKTLGLVFKRWEEGLSKNVGHHVWPKTKNLKISQYKTSENSHIKRNLDHKANDANRHIWSSSINFRFFGRKSRSQQKLAKRSLILQYSFAQKASLILRNLNSLNIIKNILPQHSQIITHFTNFPANMFLVGVRKKHFVGNKAKGRISKRVFQENKARQIFRKTDISYPLIRTRTCRMH